MPSPAERVFTIPELLELILVFMDDGDGHSVNKDHAINLFVVQRVSRDFINSIQGSRLLQYKMGLGLPLPSNVEAARNAMKDHLVSPFLTMKSIAVDPFVFQDMSALPVESTRSEWREDEEEDEEVTENSTEASDVLHVRVPAEEATMLFDIHVTTDTPSQFKGLGLLDEHSRRWDNEHHSWRRLKIIPLLNSWVHVTVRVRFRNNHQISTQLTESSESLGHNEFLDGLNGALTLGDIANMLSEIASRTSLEHAAVQALVTPSTCEDEDGDQTDLSDDDGISEDSSSKYRTLGHQKVVEYLKAIPMHLDWMEIDFDSALDHLNSIIADDPYFFWHRERLSSAESHAKTEIRVTAVRKEMLESFLLMRSRSASSTGAENDVGEVDAWDIESTASWETVSTISPGEGQSCFEEHSGTNQERNNTNARPASTSNTTWLANVATHILCFCVGWWMASSIPS